MSEDKAKTPDRKLALIAPVAIALLVLGLIAGAFFFGMGGNEPAPQAELERVVVTPAVRPPAIPVPQQEPSLTRIDLIRSANAAADAFHAASSTPAAEKDPLIGRRFSLRIPFGCGPPQLQAGSVQAQTVYDPQSKTLRLTAQPGVWTALPMIQSLPNADRIETAAGFWIPRPWTSADACPVASDPSDAVLPTTTAPSRPTLGLVQLFDTDASRLGRRDQRPYEFVRGIPQEELSLLSRFYWLTIEGRITGFANGEAIRCHSDSPLHRPVCVFGVTFDRISFVDGTTGETLAHWDE